MNKYQEIILSLTEDVGITINGSAPYDIRVHDERFYERVISDGSLGLGESYMDGWWECNQLEELFYRILSAQSANRLKLKIGESLNIIMAKIFNMQSITRSKDVTRIHYDISNDFFEKMLDERMIYSCGYWKNASCLNQAQEQKMDLICKKINLSSEDSLLDIGCGWGGFIKFAAENYNCKSVGITLSKKQADYARKNCSGLPIEILTDDYRVLSKKNQQYSKIVSIGMFEHVGPKNYRNFMKIMSEILSNDGMCLVQTIGDNISKYRCDPWLDKYIFPNGIAPSIQHIGKSIEGIFIIEDLHNFGPDYHKTLLAWHDNFKSNIQQFDMELPFSEGKFIRMWEYYLLSFASAFRARHLQLWQIVMTKGHGNSEYQSVR